MGLPQLAYSAVNNSPYSLLIKVGIVISIIVAIAGVGAYSMNKWNAGTMEKMKAKLNSTIKERDSYALAYNARVQDDIINNQMNQNIIDRLSKMRVNVYTTIEGLQNGKTPDTPIDNNPVVMFPAGVPVIPKMSNMSTVR